MPQALAGGEDDTGQLVILERGNNRVRLKFGQETRNNPGEPDFHPAHPGRSKWRSRCKVTHRLWTYADDNPWIGYRKS